MALRHLPALALLEFRTSELVHWAFTGMNHAVETGIGSVQQAIPDASLDLSRLLCSPFVG